jgi:hypothetical protein
MTVLLTTRSHSSACSSSTAAANAPAETFWAGYGATPVVDGVAPKRNARRRTRLANERAILGSVFCRFGQGLNPKPNDQITIDRSPPLKTFVVSPSD